MGWDPELSAFDVYAALRRAAREDQENLTHALRYIPLATGVDAQRYSEESFVVPVAVFQGRGEEQEVLSRVMLSAPHHLAFLTDEDLEAESAQGRSPLIVHDSELEACRFVLPEGFPSPEPTERVSLGRAETYDAYMFLRVAGLGTLNVCLFLQKWGNGPMRWIMQRRIEAVIARVAGVVNAPGPSPQPQGAAGGRDPDAGEEDEGRFEASFAVAAEDAFNLRNALRYIDHSDPRYDEQLYAKFSYLLPVTAFWSRGEQQQWPGHLLSTPHRFLFLRPADIEADSAEGREVYGLDVEEISSCIFRAPEEFGEFEPTPGVSVQPSTDGEAYIHLMLRRHEPLNLRLSYGQWGPGLMRDLIRERYARVVQRVARVLYR